MSFKYDESQQKRTMKFGRMIVSGFISNLSGESNPKRMPKHVFFGAQHLDYKTAQRADTSKQHYTVCPRPLVC
jgi:hypothetical protein